MNPVGSPTQLLDLLNASSEKGNVDQIYKICDILVQQLSDVTDAFEKEREARLKAEKQLEKVTTEKDRYRNMCKVAGEQIYQDRRFILEALEKAIERERKISELERLQQDNEQPTAQIARLVDMEKISAFLKKSQRGGGGGGRTKKKPLSSRHLSDLNPNTHTHRSKITSNP
eukprot:TRINITY_DN20853_c0_g1_i1.p1 TRINITY_DN20853_c0_g1~~TRINITY_DN20853_c0_g1_i1.p1  ORF type:complete len:172 (+),score=42.70 TRINITY_DN20853_c0_g1_i1:29-544(+)